MKHQIFLLIASFTSFSLSACSFIRPDFDSNSSPSYTSTFAPTTLDSDSESTTSTSTNSSSSSSSGYSSSTGYVPPSSSSSNESATSTTNSTSIDTSSLSTITIDSSNFYISGSYSTGNYGSTDVSGKTFSYYRAISSSSMVTLLPYYNNSGDGTIAGSLSNKTAYSGIKKMVVKYSNESSNNSKDGIKAYYGTSYPLTTYQTNYLSSSVTTLTIEDASGFNYFSVETSGYRLTIESITLYNKSGSTPSLSYLNSGDGVYRINNTLNSSPSNGDIAEVPTSIQRNGNTYSVTSTKTYTYKSLSNASSSDALHDPIDVASYYASFGTWPANFYYNNQYEVSSTFGSGYSSIHKVSFYNRTSGYVNAIPELTDNHNFTSTGYYELDIYLGDNSRGVGRLVIFVDGLEDIVDGYKNSLIVYTDDHYATFQEFLGYGFGPRFDAEQFKTATNWSAATTLTLG